MRDLFTKIENWLSAGKSVALSTVINTWGSSPRQVGAGMAVTSDEDVAGSVSGGCVEGAVIDRSLEVIKTGKPALLHFGVADDEAWEVGLACGGEIDVFVRVFSEQDLETWKKALSSNQIFCSVLVISGVEILPGEELILLEDERWFGAEFPNERHEDILSSAAGAIQKGSSQLVGSSWDPKETIFYHIVKPRPTLILVGGVHIAIPLVELANVVGFEVVVIDPRRLFSTSERFPDVKALYSEWPDTAFQYLQINQSTAVVMLTHDPKIDDPALKIALNSPAFYVGALGSKKTHQKRIDRLLRDGVDQARLERIHAPVGLNLSGRSPQEIALAIMAEIIQVWNSPKKIKLK
jgi:xanthine dehydrogenase accessory factor